MSFLRRGKNRKRPASEVEITPPVKHPKKRKITPVEVKLLAIDALKAGIPSLEVCQLIGVSNSALGKWRKLYQEGGDGALARQATNPGTRRICSHLERRIEQMRCENPKAGVRRIRDELRHGQGSHLGISGVDLYGGTRHSSARSLKMTRTPEEIKRATMHTTNKSFERYFQIEMDDVRGIYAETQLAPDLPHLNSGSRRVKLFKFK